MSDRTHKNQHVHARILEAIPVNRDTNLRSVRAKVDLEAFHLQRAVEAMESLGLIYLDRVGKGWRSWRIRSRQAPAAPEAVTVAYFDTLQASVATEGRISSQVFNTWARLGLLKGATQNSRKGPWLIPQATVENIKGYLLASMGERQRIRKEWVKEASHGRRPAGMPDYTPDPRRGGQTGQTPEQQQVPEIEEPEEPRTPQQLPLQLEPPKLDGVVNRLLALGEALAAASRSVVDLGAELEKVQEATGRGA